MLMAKQGFDSGPPVNFLCIDYQISSQPTFYIISCHAVSRCCTRRVRSGKVDWRLICAIDPDSIYRRGDVSALQVIALMLSLHYSFYGRNLCQAVIENLTFSDIEHDAISARDEADVLKFCKLSQFCLEYLLFCQQELDRYDLILGLTISFPRLMSFPSC